MRRYLVIFAASCLTLSNAMAEDYVLGMNFVVSHPTTISALGAYDGGSPFTTSEMVAIFNDVTGVLAGPEALFGPGDAGVQLGDTFYENVVPNFVLMPGDYSVISIGADGSAANGGGSLAGGNTYQNLGDDVNLPGGERFNSGAYNVALGEGPGAGLPGQTFDLVDPPSAPDGGLTALFLGAALAGLSWARRKF